MLQKILSRMRKAIEDYRMIEDGDHVAVGVSGGKDSLVLLMALRELQRFLPVKFKLTAITISLGFPAFDHAALVAFYEHLGVEWHVEETVIGEVVFETRKESNPCALCANMKRGTIHAVARRLGCNKVAFGHHMDDAIETLLLSLVYEGRLHCFSPVTVLDRSGVTLIRPMIYTEEKMVRAFARKEGLTPIKSGCPVDGTTKRETATDLIRQLKQENPDIRAALFGAIQRAGLNGWKPMGKSSQYKKGHPQEEDTASSAPPPSNAASTLGAASQNALDDTFFRMMIDHLPIAGSITRDSDNTLLYTNRHAEEMFDTPFTETLNQPIDQIFSQAGDLVRIRNSLLTSGSLRDLELQLLDARGRKFWSILSAERITYGGEPARLMAMSRIDALKEMEEKLKRSHARQTLILGMLLQLYHPSDLGQSYSNVLGLTGRYLDIDRASLFSFQQDGSLRLRQEWVTGKRLPPGKDAVRLSDWRSPVLNKLCDWMRHRSRFYAGVDEVTDLEASGLPEIPHPWVAQTLRISDKPVALMLFEDYRPDHTWSEDDMMTLDAVGFIMTMAHERRKTEIALQAASRKAQEASITKSRFLANMSHELRTPLNAILGFMDLLESTTSSNEQREYVMEAKNASDMLLYLINDVLDYSKIEAGHLTLESIRFDLRSCVENAAAMHAPRAQDRGVRLGIYIDPSLPAELVGDPTRLGQILTNLVGNAVKFTSEGDILVEVLPEEIDAAHRQNRRSLHNRNMLPTDHAFVDASPSPEDDTIPHPARLALAHSLAGDIFPYLATDEIPGQMRLPEPQTDNQRRIVRPDRPDIGIALRISDSGIGMSRAVMSRLFQPFTQADSSITRQFGGTGLGLAITHRLVEMMHGWMTVDSREGQGSSFTCHLTFAASEMQPAEAETAVAHHITMEMPSSVLVITGSRMQGNILSHYFDSAGIRSTVVNSSVLAVGAMTEDTAWSAIFLADDLPDYPAESLIDILQGMPTGTNVPLFLLTPLGTARNREHGDDPRISGTLPVPVRHRDLLRLLHKQKERMAEENTVPPNHEDGPDIPTAHPVNAKPIPATTVQMTTQLLETDTLQKIDTASSTEQPPSPMPLLLLVEDNPTNRIVFVNMLRVYGLTCDTAPDGLEASQACEHRQYDIIFMDCQMPVLDGYAATRIIRRSGRSRNARILALTAHAMSGDREKCLEAGMDDHLGKPVTMKVLFSRLDALLAELGFDRPMPESRLPITAADPILGQPSDGNRQKEDSPPWPPEHPVQEAINQLMEAPGFSQVEASDLIRLFLGELSDTIGTVPGTFPHHPPEELSRRIHRHNGSAGSLRLMRFHRQLSAFEQAFQTHEKTLQHSILDDLRCLLAQYRPYGVPPQKPT